MPMRNAISEQNANGDAQELRKVNGSEPQPTAVKTVCNESFSAGRLSKPMSRLVQKHNEEPRLAWEVKNLSAVLQVDEAHVVMLAEQGLLTRPQAGAILGALDHLKCKGSANFSTSPGYGSIVLQVEKLLAERIGEDVAGRLSIARSRLDQGATVRRISDRQKLLKVAHSLVALLETLAQVAKDHKHTATLSYTHLQQAQPATFGHYLLAFEDRLEDAFQQLTQTYFRIDRSPLGAVGLSGTNLPTNRHRTAALLGFSQILENSRRGRDAYYQIDMACLLAMVMTIINDLCTDLHVFSSTEFGTIELDDSHCSTSSIFPQKKNPYALETVKNVAQDAQGWVAIALATFRNEGTGDTANRGLGLLNDACEKTSEMLLLTAEIVRLMTVRQERYKTLLDKAWVTTNSLANELLINHGMSYRTAHGVVARLVKNCLAEGVSRADVTCELFRVAAKQMGENSISMDEEELRAALDPLEYIRNSSSLGGIGPEQFDRLLNVSEEHIVKDRAWIDEKEKHLANSAVELGEASQKLRKIALL